MVVALPLNPNMLFPVLPCLDITIRLAGVYYVQELKIMISCGGLKTSLLGLAPNGHCRIVIYSF